MEFSEYTSWSKFKMNGLNKQEGYSGLLYLALSTKACFVKNPYVLNVRNH
jgi:hypothetical protein